MANTNCAPKNAKENQQNQLQLPWEECERSRPITLAFFLLLSLFSGRNHRGLCLFCFFMAFSGFRRAHCGRFPIARCHNIRIFACNCVSITNRCQRFGAEHERPTDPECSVSACERLLRVCDCMCVCVCVDFQLKCIGALHYLRIHSATVCDCVCTPSCLSKLAFNDVDARSASGNIAAYNYGHSNNNNA